MQVAEKCVEYGRDRVKLVYDIDQKQNEAE